MRPLANFEIAVLFSRLYGKGKSVAISKLVDYLRTSSPSYIVLALVWTIRTYKGIFNRKCLDKIKKRKDFQLTADLKIKQSQPFASFLCPDKETHQPIKCRSLAFPNFPKISRFPVSPNSLVF